MLDMLPQQTKLEVNLILKCKHPRGILHRLSNYFKTLQLNKITSSYIQQCVEESTNRSKAHEVQRQETIIWFEDKIQLLKSSQWAEHPTVKSKIQNAENALQGKSCNPLMRAFSHVWDQFKEATYSVAAFGHHILFDGWAIAGIYNGTIHKVVENFPSKFTEQEKWKLSTELGKGFISYNSSAYENQRSPLRPIPCNFANNSPNEKIKFIELSHGIIKEFSIPQNVEVVLFGDTSQEDWEVDCESDPITLFTHLQVLAKYEQYKGKKFKPLTELQTMNPTTLEEADELISNWLIGYYLRRFDSKDPAQHPASLKELKDLVETFSTMLGTFIDQGNIPEADKKERKPRNDARTRDRAIAKKWMEEKWSDQTISQSSMVAKFRLAIGKGDVKLEREYKPSSGNTEGTFEKWTREIDPWPESYKRSRPKTSNLRAF